AGSATTWGGGEPSCPGTGRSSARRPPAKCWASSRAGHVEAPSPSSTRLATRRTTTRSWCAPSLHDGSGRGRGSRGGAAGRLPVAVAHGEEPPQRPDVRRAVGPEGDRSPVVVVAEARAGEDLVDRLTRAEVDRGEIVGVGPPRRVRTLRVEVEE